MSEQASGTMHRFDSHPSRRRIAGLPQWIKAVAVSSAVLLALVGAAAISSNARRRTAVQYESPEIQLLAEQEEGSCALYQCNVFNPRNKCQCNGACVDHNSCCSDYKEQCADKPRDLLDSKPQKLEKVVYDLDLMWQSGAMRSAMEHQMVLAKKKEQMRHEQEEHLEAAEKAALARAKAKENGMNETKMPTVQDIKEKREEQQRKTIVEAGQQTKQWHEAARSIFIHTLADLLGGSNSTDDAKLARAVTKAVITREENEKKELERKKEEEKKLEEEKKKIKEAAKQAIRDWKTDEVKVPNVSLYCFSLMMPFGYEPGLLAEHKKRIVGIYACDEHVVFSNVTRLMSGEASPVSVHVVDESLAVPYGGRWMTALNTGVFNRIWMEVITLQRYRFHDWAVKADPDAVFFPDRLRILLRHKEPYNRIPPHTAEPDDFSKCNTCRLSDHTEESCASHVRWWQTQGKTCPEALELIAREPPEDCGCECDDFACDLPEATVYLNNCKWGLHGPIEVLSRRAVATFAAGLPKCVSLLEHPWGEDKFLDQCLQLLEVNRDDEYSLLSETACGEQPAPCGSTNVAFHPFKSIQSYFTCHAYASKYGHGPANMPTYEEFERAANANAEDDDGDEEGQ